MTWTLLRKELRQHWVGLLTLLAAGCVCNLLILGSVVAQGKKGSPFEGFQIYVVLMGLAGAMVLNHRLVVLEYQAKTQLFLEALPVARWRMIAVKYGLGLGVMIALTGFGFSTASLLALSHGGLTARYAAIVATRSLSAIWLAQSFCFLMGLTGRYRFALYLVMMVGCGVLSEFRQLELRHFGPVALLDSRFPYEREIFPWQALGVTWGLSLMFTIFAAVLSLVREGSLAEMLAEKMSHREKVVLTAFVCGLLFTATTLSEKIKKAPFDLQHAATALEPGIRVKVAAGAGEDDPESQRLARHVAKELSAMRDYLGIQKLPPLFIVRRRDLDADRFERGELPKSEGIHVQANFTSRDWHDEPFIAWLVPEVLAGANHDRKKRESQRWVLDGFGAFWAGREHFTGELTLDRALALRALYGAETGFTLRDLRDWLRFRERVGPGIAEGVAWSGLKTLARRQGSERCHRFLRTVLGTEEHKDFRALFTAASWQQRLREQVGETPEVFFSEWQAELAACKPALAGELSALPRLSGQMGFVQMSADSRKARFRLNITPTPGADLRYSVLYGQLPAYDEEPDLKSLQREQNNYQQSPEAELPQAYSRGQRLYWTLAVDVPALGCEVVSGYNRQEIQ
jgi:uncharacterized membrane protein